MNKEDDFKTTENNNNQTEDNNISKNNKLGILLKFGAISAVPPLLGHYIRKKNGDINNWLVGLGVITSLTGSIYQNQELFQTQEDSYLTKIEYPTKNSGLEQYLISRNETELEIFQKNNPTITQHKTQSFGEFSYSIGHTLTNLITPIPLSKLVNKIQGNSPTNIHEFVGNFSYDVINSNYSVNKKRKGIGNCNYVINGDKITFNNSPKEKINCKQAYNKLK